MDVLLGMLFLFSFLFFFVFSIWWIVNKIRKKEGQAGRNALISLAVFFLSIFIFSPDDTTQNQSNKSKPIEFTKNDEPDLLTLKQQQEAKIASLPKKGVSSDVTIQVLSSQNASQVGGEFFNQKANGVFKVISIAIYNGQKDAITIDSNSFVLIDDQGREYRASSQAQTAMMSEQTEVFFLTSLNPGLAINGKIAFDVPNTSSKYHLQASGGMLGETILLAID